MIPPLRLSFLLLSAVALGIGCNKSDEQAIRTYPAPKDAPAPAMVDAGGQGDSDEGTSDVAMPQPHGGVQWTLPAGWKEVPSTEKIRLATFQVSADDPTAVVTLVNMGPQELAPNLGRWADQLHLSASDAELLRAVSKEQIGAASADVAQLTGPADGTNPPKSILAALVPHGRLTLIVKLWAPAAVVSAHKANFESFLHSLRFADEQTQPDAPQISSSPASQRLAKWTAPPGWVEVQNPSQVRVLSFRVGPSENAADAAVEKFPAGVLAEWVPNLNRWRGQVGLEPAADPNSAKGSEVSVGGRPGQLYEFVGPSKALLIAIVRKGDAAWFFKLQGPGDVVTSQKAAFVDFLKSVQFE